MTGSESAARKQRIVDGANVTDHLNEIADLAAQSIGELIELLPAYDANQTDGERAQKVQSLLVNLRAIQHEAEDMKKEGAP